MEMLQIGEFDSRIDKDLLSLKIAQVCGPMTPVHDTSDSYVTFHKLFFKMWGTQISKLLDTLEYDYDPLVNYRRDEDKKQHTTDNITDTDVLNDRTAGEVTESSANEQKVSAYNEDLYQPENKSEYTNDESREVTRNRNDDYTRDRKGTAVEKNSIRGLNGLVTSQQLLTQEREVAQYNIYQWIVNKYMEELFICVF